MKQIDADIMFGEVIAVIAFLTTFYMIKHSNSLPLEKTFLTAVCIFLLVSLFNIGIITTKKTRDDYVSPKTKQIQMEF